MKCRECGSCYKGFWASQPESYVCVESNNTLEILDINAECIISNTDEKHHELSNSIN